MNETEDRLQRVIISPRASINEAIARLDKAGTGALALCREDQTLFGMLTDGDIRRAILAGIPLATACEQVCSQKPVTVPPGASAVRALHLMNEHDVHHLPIVAANGELVGFLLRRDLVSEEQVAMSAVIVAGGFGTRLWPLTQDVPKPMLPVGDRPLLERTLEKLRKAGIHRVSLTTHHLAQKIVNHFGDGRAFGVKLDYVNEEHPLGTAGGLKLLKNVTEPLLVINGDVLTRLPFQEMLNYHRRQKAVCTVGVRKYDVQVPFGVVDCEGSRVRGIREKPSVSYLVNAGTYLLEPLVQDFIPDNQRFDMPDLLARLIKEGLPVVSFPIIEYWLDVGRHQDYEQAQDDALAGRV